MAMESVHLLISETSGGVGSRHGLPDYGVIKVEAEDVSLRLPY